VSKVNDMNLHDNITQAGLEIWRVPGGWIYGCSSGMVFVPYSDEFSNDPSVPTDEQSK
jgi:hypothetical protein